MANVPFLMDAIVSRELGMSHIIGLINGTALLKTGDWVVENVGKGIVPNIKMI